jgi:hypothetical protein
LWYLLLGVLIVGSTACQIEKPQSVKQAYQRFVPVPREPQNIAGLPWSGAFALDTKTGSLCWTYKIENHTQNDVWPALQDCFDLYQQYPDEPAVAHKE